MSFFLWCPLWLLFSAKQNCEWILISLIFRIHLSWASKGILWHLQASFACFIYYKTTSNFFSSLYLPSRGRLPGFRSRYSSLPLTSDRASYCSNPPPDQAHKCVPPVPVPLCFLFSLGSTQLFCQVGVSLLHTPRCIPLVPMNKFISSFKHLFAASRL